MEQITISVLVITYNHEAYIKQTLENIVAQQGSFHLEIVISNDCSTDGTDRVIRYFIENYQGNATIRYFQQEANLGILPNLLFALEQCGGDFLAMCEGDDFWISADKLQLQLDFYKKNADCSLVISNRKVFREDQTVYDELYDQFHQKKVFTRTDVIEGFVPGLQTMFARNDKGLRQYLYENRDLDHADRYIAYYFMLQGKMYLLTEITAVYRMTGLGAWSSYNGLRMLQVKAEMLADFHRRIGLSMDNPILRKTQKNCSYATLRYCFKRPSEFSKPSNKEWIRGIWKPGQFPCKVRLLDK